MKLTPETELADAVRAAGISTTADLYALVLKLTPAEAALLEILFGADAPVPALELRRASEGLLSNVSLVARSLNSKLAAAGDTRRAVATVSRGGLRGSVAHWFLAEPATGAA